MLLRLSFYLVVFIIIFYLLLTLYLKCKMPFWAKQPVFHIYNLFYWLRPPGLIMREMPLLNKYMDFLHIQTFPVEEGEAVLLKTVCHFIKHNYLSHTGQVQGHMQGQAQGHMQGQAQVQAATYTPTPPQLIAYLQAANHAAYYTVYQQPKLLFNKNVPETTVDDLLAVVTARPLYVRLTQGRQKIMLPTYYVDNLCVQPAYRKKNIAAQMIQTHYYNLRAQNKQIQTCLFKREGDLNAIVPLVTFHTYCVELEQISTHFHTRFIGSALACTELGHAQLHLFVDFIKDQMPQFNCVILPDVSNIAHLLKTANLRVYILVDQAQIIACYVFRLTALTYGTRPTCECITTVAACTPARFSHGFGLACTALRPQYSQVLIEETAHAHLILAALKQKKITPLFQSPTAFFFYNYACYSIKKNEFLIIY